MKILQKVLGSYFFDLHCSVRIRLNCLQTSRVTFLPFHSSGVTRNSGAPGEISKSSPQSPFPICLRHPLSLPYPTSPSFWPRVGPGHPSSPLSIYFLIFPPLLFSFFHWIYLFSFVHPFPFYQNSPTPFPGQRS